MYPLRLARLAFSALLVLGLTAVVGCDSGDSEPEPTTGTISGVISLPAGAAGDIVNTRVSLYETLDEFVSNAPTFSTTAAADGGYSFEDVNPDSYYLAAFKDNDNSGAVSSGDFYGYLGGGPLDPSQATPQRQQVVIGQNTGINFVIQIVPPGFGVTLTGVYTGTTSDSETMTLTLSQSGDAVTGTGSVVGPDASYQLSVNATGTFSSSGLTLSLTSAQLGSPITLQGTVSDDGDRIDATLNGGALGDGTQFYTNDTVTLTR